MTSHEYICPSYRLRIVKKSSLDTICNRCEGKGWYRASRDSKQLLVCGFYETYIENCIKKEEEERLEMWRKKNERKDD